jgi:tRNA modification GTPase
MTSDRDTIFALSSGRPPAAIAVIRISGPRARHALQALIGRVPEPRRAALARVRDPDTQEIFDEALALFFPGPNSETGEDTAELQLHGGRAVIAGVIGALGRLEGFRGAEAGEFTRRAFENGRLDLTQVEGLEDLISAETAAQRRQAFRHLKGLLGERAETWRARLIEALALVEAGIDFSDEADVPNDLIGPALRNVADLRAEITRALAGAGRGERLREGLVVAIAGPPNAGKSTLLNRLARREAAIVSPYAGTTRDVIEVHLDLEGYPVTLLDTAGIRDSNDPVEQEGIRRARKRAAEADLVLWVVDASGETAQQLPARLATDPVTWVIRNKVDLWEYDMLVADGPQRRVASMERGAENIDDRENNAVPSVEQRRISEPEFRFIALSAHTGHGFEEFLVRLVGYAQAELEGQEPALVVRDRHRQILEDVGAALDHAAHPATIGHEEMVAEELRMAARGLGKLTGRVDVEDVLDVIFRDFCIGK